MLTGRFPGGRHAAGPRSWRACDASHATLLTGHENGLRALRAAQNDEDLSRRAHGKFSKL